MAMLLINAPTTDSVISQVSYWQGQGFAPACGLTYHNGIYYQPMVAGATTIPYGIIDEATDVAFRNGANYAATEYGAFALGDMQIINSRFVQAFGAPVSASSPVDEGAVLAIINAATLDSPDYAGLQAFVQAVIDAQP